MTTTTKLEPPRPRQAVKQIVVTPPVEDHPGTDKIIERASRYDIEVTRGELAEKNGSINQVFRHEKQTLRLTKNKGSFIKPWESHPRLIGEDEWCLTPVEGCPLDCSYCYLQDYLDRPLVSAFVNQEAMRDQLRCFLDDPPQDPPHYFSLGELSDGLFLEPLIGNLPGVWDVFDDYEHTHLEVRTKSHHVHDIPDRVTPHDSGVFTWSLSPEGTARSDEMLTADLDQRLVAMKYMNGADFKVAARLDPVLYGPDWETEYRTLIDRMFEAVDPADLEFIIVGTFRFPRGFDRTMEERFPNRDFLREEFVEGPDGKFRYPRSLRTEVFARLNEMLVDRGVSPDLCMEPSYVWEDAGIKQSPAMHPSVNDA